MVSQNNSPATPVKSINDPNIGILYDISPSRNEVCATITFYAKTTYEKYLLLLRDLYDLKRNPTNSALTTAIITEGQKVVLTLYNSYKLVQEAGCNSWLDSVFSQLYKRLPNASDKENSDNSSTPDRQTNGIIRDTPSKQQSHGSPLNLFSKVFGKIKSPKTPTSPVNRYFYQSMQTSKQQSAKAIMDRTIIDQRKSKRLLNILSLIMK